MNYPGVNVRYKIKKDSLSLIYFLILLLMCGVIVSLTAAGMFWSRMNDIDKMNDLISMCKCNISMNKENHI